ncbi:MAG: hypothetical protein LBB05_03675 [Puniceicoccales bacterium]|jgi:hypothetical protein|nr:hypothetical protein [Puniceicoccales bacterium]
MGKIFKIYYIIALALTFPNAWAVRYWGVPANENRWNGLPVLLKNRWEPISIPRNAVQSARLFPREGWKIEPKKIPLNLAELPVLLKNR